MTAANTVFEWTEVQRRQENNLNSAVGVSEAADRALLDSLITGGLLSPALTIPAGIANAQTRETQAQVASATQAVNIAATAPSGTNNIPVPANPVPGNNTEVPPFVQNSTAVISTPIATPTVTGSRAISGDPAADRVLFTLAAPASISEDPALEPNISFGAPNPLSAPAAAESAQPVSSDAVPRDVVNDDSTGVDEAIAAQARQIIPRDVVNDDSTGVDEAIATQARQTIPRDIVNDDSTGVDDAIAANQQNNADLGLLGINPDFINVNPNLGTGVVSEVRGRLENTRVTERRPRSSDWRFRISISENTQYLYNDPDTSSILNPLKATKGVIFPYTPKIDVSYVATYSSVDITHSNYKFHNYTGSSVEQVSITGDFTAQDTFEANYLLAVIHFFRSVTKMFYGKDQNPAAGTPPPLCYLNGHGTYAFNNHPCVITNFTLSYPNDVDYVNAKVPFGNLNNSPMYNKPIIGPATRWQRLANLTKTGVNTGGTRTSPVFQNPVNDLSELTRVPSRLSITISALPVVTRNDLSNNFSLQKYATGELLKSNRPTITGKPSKGGFW